MSETDVRWQQRFASYVRALQQLRAAVVLAAERELSELERQGMIQAFEFTHEFAWNVMKDYFVYQGSVQVNGSRDAIRLAFSVGLLEDGEAWMDMIKSRNQSTHTYNRATAEFLSTRITTQYLDLFDRFALKMRALEVHGD